jgi:hypothetical protein
MISGLLCRSAVDDLSCDLKPDQFLDYFVNKINQIHTNTYNAGEVVYSSYNGPSFSQFATTSEQDIICLIKSASSKQCSLDPVPTWLIKECADLLAPFASLLVNRSLSEGYVPTSQKYAVIRPMQKKQSLDP